MKKLLMATAVLMLAVSMLVTGCSQSDDSRVVIPVPDLRDVSVGPGIIWSQQNVGLWVDGQGKVSATPDIAVLTLGVEVQQKTVAEAQKQAASDMADRMNVIKGKGVADKDIQTQNYNISRVTKWDSDRNEQILLGYKVTNTIVIKIRKLDDTGTIIDAVAGAAGDNIRINGIGFSIDDPSEYYKQAREKAIDDAMEKAKQIASSSGIKLGKVLYINESTPYVPSPVISFSKMEAADTAVPTTPISSGELDITVNIQMVYDID